MILVFAARPAIAQSQDSIKPPLIFGKYERPFSDVTRTDQFGRFGSAFNEAYFIDMRLPVQSRTLLACGPLMYRMERYCR